MKFNSKDCFPPDEKELEMQGSDRNSHLCDKINQEFKINEISHSY